MNARPAEAPRAFTGFSRAVFDWYKTAGYGLIVDRPRTGLGWLAGAGLALIRSGSAQRGVSAS